MNVVDSSGWIEYFTDGANARFFLPAIRDTSHLIVPAVCVYEVYRHALAHRTSELALEFYKAMSLGRIVELDGELSASAAALAHHHKLAMADSMILATARKFDGALWSQDADFERFENVKYVPKRK